MEKYLDPSCYVCIQGAVPETTKLLDQKWDKIFYLEHNGAAGSDGANSGAE